MPELIGNAAYAFAEKMREIFGDKLSKVIVYGSYARGDYRDNSDLDIMVLVDMSDEEIEQREYAVYDYAFDIEMDIGIDISAIIKNESHFEYWEEVLPFYRNIKREGVVISE